MATPLRMPDMGTVEGEVTIIRWLKAEGDIIVLGEPLFEVETDKGVSEVESAIAGVLATVIVAAGAKAAAGQTIALIRRADEPKDASAPGASSTLVTPRIAPAIRALAEKRGVDLATVRGTGFGGAVRREDVLRSAGSAGPGPVERPAASPEPRAAVSYGQAIVARKVSESYREKPTYRVHALVDMTKIVAARQKLKEGTGATPSYDAYFLKAAATAIVELPVFRRYIRGERAAEHNSADVALAIGIDDALSIAAVRGAAGKSLSAITEEIETLATKALARTLRAEDVDGSCFLVSNLGMFPIEGFDAIIYPEHSAALAVGAIARTPVARGETVCIAPLARMTLSADHRLINGKTAALFLTRVKEILEIGGFE